MLSSFCSPLNSIPDIPGIILVVTAGIILVVGIISVVIGGHFGGGDHFDGGDHFGGGTAPLSQKSYNILLYFDRAIFAFDPGSHYRQKMIAPRHKIQ